MFKRILAFALAGCLVFESAPMTALAAEPQTEMASELTLDKGEEEVGSTSQEEASTEAGTETQTEEALPKEEASDRGAATEETIGQTEAAETEALETEAQETETAETEEAVGEEGSAEEGSTEEDFTEETLTEESSAEENSTKEEGTSEQEEAQNTEDKETVVNGEGNRTNSGTQALSVTTEQEGPQALGEGSNAITLPARDKDGNTKEVWYTFTAPSQGRYLFFADRTSTSISSYVYLHKDTSAGEYLQYGYVSSYSVLNLLSEDMQEGETVYLRAFTQAEEEVGLSLDIQKIPEYTLTGQGGGSYTATTDTYTLTVDLEMGYQRLRGRALLTAGAGQVLDEYYLRVYCQKPGSRDKKDGSCSLIGGQSSSFMCDLDGAGEYRVYLVLQDGKAEKTLAVFDGNILLTASATDAPYVIKDTIITENSITFDMEKFTAGFCYWGPVDGSAEEQKVSANEGWYNLSITGLQPDTEYYFEFTDQNNRVVGTERVTTAKTTTEAVFDAVLSDKDWKLTLTAAVTDYQGTASRAYLCYEYIDMLGRTQAGKTEYDLSKAEVQENGGKNFTITAEHSPLLLENTTCDLTMWIEFDGVEYGKMVKQLTTPTAAVTAQEVQFSVNSNTENKVAKVTINAKIGQSPLQAYVLYKPQSDLSSSYKEASVAVSNGTDAFVECSDIQLGVPYNFILFIGGSKRETSATIGTASVQLSPIGTAKVNAFDFVRTFKAEGSDAKELTGTYYLRMEYMFEGSSSYTSFEHTLTLNEENGYQADFSTAAGNLGLLPDREYRIKWTLSSSTDVDVIPLSTYYETIQTKKADITIESAGNYHDQKEYNITLNPESVANFAASVRFHVYGYVRKQGSAVWRQLGSVSLSSSSEYKGTLILSGLEEETSYDLSLRSSSDTEYTEYDLVSFTTPADTRALTLVSVDARPYSAQINYSMDAARSTYVLCYIRPKGTGDKWEKAAYSKQTGESRAGSLSVLRYGSKELKDETVYEYQIGFGKNQNTTLADLEKILAGEFKTAKDTRKIKAGISAGYTTADISVEFSGNTHRIDSYLHFFYRKKGAAQWSRASHHNTTQTAANHNARLTGLMLNTVYEYAVIVTDSYGYTNPDEITVAEQKAVGQFTTKSNAYTLDFVLNESNTTSEKAVVSVTAKGSDEDRIVYVTLTLNDGQEQTVSLKRGNGYNREVAFTNLAYGTEYMIIDAVFSVTENNRLVEIGEPVACGFKFTTKKAEVPTSITLNEEAVSLNVIYGNEQIEGFNTKTLTANVKPKTAAKDLIWRSSDTNVIEVSETGVITPKNIGQAVITVASVYDESIKASCKVTIKRYAIGYTDTNGKVQILDSIDTWSVYKKNSLDQFKYYEVSAGGNTTRLTEYTVTPVKEGIVAVKDGKLEAIGIGQTRVDFEKDGVKAAIEVRVSAAGRGFGIVGIDHNDSDYPAIKTGENSYTLALGANPYTVQGKISPEQEFNPKDFIWNISDPTVAEVDEAGNIRPLTQGKVTLTVTPRNDSTKTPYIQSKAEVELVIKPLPTAVAKPVLYAVTNVSSKIGDVRFPESWGQGWSWKNPKTPLVTNGVYTDNSYEFKAVYSGSECYPGEVGVQVYIGKITGISVTEKGDDHRQVLETGQTDSMTLAVEVLSQGKVTEGDYSIELPEVRGLTITKNTDGSYRITAQKAGKYRLRPVVKIGNKKITGSYSFTAVNVKQAASIVFSTDTEGVVIDGNKVIFETAKAKKDFQLKATVKDRTGAELETKLVWKSTDKSVVDVKAVDKKDTHKVKVTAKGEGHAVLTVTAKDKAGYQASLNVEVQNHAPRVNTQKTTVNLAYDYNTLAGKGLASEEGLVEIVPAYEGTISNVQLLDKEGKNPDINIQLVSYGKYTYLAVPTREEVPVGTHQCTLRVKTAKGDSYDYPLKISVVSKKATVTARMDTAVNLFYTNSTADIVLNISNGARVEDAVWIDVARGANNGFSMSGYYEMSGGKYASYVTVSQQEKLKVVDGEPKDVTVAKGTLTVTLHGYRDSYTFKDFEVKYTYKKPTLVSKSKSTAIAPDLGQNGNTFYLYNETEKKYMIFNPGKYAGYVNELVCEDENVELTTYSSSAQVKYVYTGQNSSHSIKMMADSSVWREPVQVVHTIQQKAAKAVLEDSVLTYNTFAKNSLSTRIYLHDKISISYTDIVVKGADKKAQKLLDEDLFVVTTSDNLIDIKYSDAKLLNTTIAAGTYKYKVTPYYTSIQTGKKTAMNTLTLTIKVVNKAVTAKISAKGTIDLANGREYDMRTKKNCVWLAPKFSNLPSGYTITDYRLTGEYSDYFTMGYGNVLSNSSHTYHYYMTVSDTGVGKLKAGQVYKLAVEYLMENEAGQTITVTSNIFNIKPKQSKPNVTVKNNNQTLYAGADNVFRTYMLSVPSYYSIEKAFGGLDCNKDGTSDITVSGGSEGYLIVRITDRDAVGASAAGKVYTIPVTVVVTGGDGITKEAVMKIKVTVKR